MDDNLPNTSGVLNDQQNSTGFPPASNANNGGVNQSSSGIAVNNPPNVQNPVPNIGIGNPNLNMPPTISAGVSKEVVRVSNAESFLDETEKSVEISPELEKSGVQKVSGEVVIPPQLKQMGVQHAGPTAPVSSQVSVSLPITDDQVLKGLHANIFDAFRWLAVWCVRRLKMAHLALKNVHGKVMRVKQG